jgi:serine/threonine protein kinase
MQQLGRGAFGAVFYDKQRNQVVKKSNPRQSRSEQENTRLVRQQARILELLSENPRVVDFIAKFHSYQESKNQLRMEALLPPKWINFATLLRITEKGESFFKRIIPSLFALVNVMSLIHDMGVVHHDLKTENLMFSKEYPYIKVIDMGLSCTEITICKEILGTPIFYDWEKRPMQTMADYYAFDVWSMGMIMYDLIHRGKTPRDQAKEMKIKDFYEDTARYLAVVNKKDPDYDLFMKTVALFHLLPVDLLNYKRYLVPMRHRIQLPTAMTAVTNMDLLKKLGPTMIYIADHPDYHSTKFFQNR